MPPIQRKIMVSLPAKIISKIAVSLMVSQILVDPTHVKAHLDASQDLETILKISNSTCAKMYDLAKKVQPERFVKTTLDEQGNEKKESFDPGEEFVTNAKNNDPDMTPLYDTFQSFCRGEPANENVKQILAQAVAYYNDAMKNIEVDAQKVVALKDHTLPQASILVDNSNKKIADVFPLGNRRVLAKLSEVPDLIRNAIITSEDKNFYAPEHHGVDALGVLRAAQSSLSSSKHPVGGSTITQQLIKNLIVGDKLEDSRKIREMYLAVLLEKTFTKDQILELYLNDDYFGQLTWGIKTAAMTYFNKELKDIRPAEAAYLAVIVRCPRGCGPSHPESYKHRVIDLLDQMVQQNKLTEKDRQQAVLDVENLSFAPFQLQASYIGDKSAEVIKAHYNIDVSITPAVIHSTINGKLQAAAQLAVEEGLVRHEINYGRARFSGPEKNLTAEVEQLRASVPGIDSDHVNPPWRRALLQTQLPLYDVQWEPAIVLADNSNTVGLRDGRVLRLTPWSGATLPKLKKYDVVYTFVKTGAKNASSAELRFRPTLQGAALILENTTGRILAMVGGFSRALSELNRAVDATRHCGSAIKPAIYLKACQAGLQPNTLVRNEPLSYEEMQQLGIKWNPANNEGMYSNTPILTLRSAIELSENQAALRLWPEMSNGDFEKTFQSIRSAIHDLGIKQDVPNDKPIILGAMDVSMQDLALFYATIANGGWRPTAQFIDSIDVGGVNYPYKNPGLSPVPASVADGVSFFQVRTLLQGVPVHGTLMFLSQNLTDIIKTGSVGDYLAGKTGTSSHYRDDWVMGFTRDYTIAAWVGYDGGKPVNGKIPDPPSLGDRATATKVTGPIFEQLFRALARNYPIRPFEGPSPKLAPYVTAVTNSEGTIDYLRNETPGGNPVDATYLVIDRYDADRYQSPSYGPSSYPPVYGEEDNRPYFPTDRSYYYPRGPQQSYTYDQQRIPQPRTQNNFFQQLFGGGWAQPRDRNDEEYQRPQYQQRPRQQQYDSYRYNQW
jgi:membrane carboxypeptidase/penicillin-binding protein